MNQFFSFKRFYLLVLNHWAENKRRYGLSIVAILGILIAWFVLAILVDSEDAMVKEIQHVTFFMFLFTIGAFYSSQYFRELGSREKGSNFLLLPASTFEKVLCSLLYSVFLFFAVFTLLFYIADTLMVGVANMLPEEGRPRKIEVANVFRVNLFSGNSAFTFNLLLFYFSIQAAFLLGSVYFHKYRFVKTIITGFAFGFFIFCLLYFLYVQLLPRGEYFEGGLTNYRVYVDGVNDYLVSLPKWIGEIMKYMVMYAIAPFFWLVTYFRLKEKQV